MTSRIGPRIRAIPEYPNVEVKKVIPNVVMSATEVGILSFASSFLRKSESNEVRTMLVVEQARITLSLIHISEPTRPY